MLLVFVLIGIDFWYASYDLMPWPFPLALFQMHFPLMALMILPVIDRKNKDSKKIVIGGIISTVCLSAIIAWHHFIYI
jgi:hypothetical protein